MTEQLDEGYFNDLSRKVYQSPSQSISPQEHSTTSASTTHHDNSEIPKTKRIACVICRKRKLKCDGNRPKCATCARLNHACAYEEVRKKSGPKRGYVKELEARLAQVETQLQGKDGDSHSAPPQQPQTLQEEKSYDSVLPDLQPAISEPTMFDVMPDLTFGSMTGNDMAFSPTVSNMVPEAMPSTTSNNDFNPSMNFGLDDNFSWEMIGLGLEEPMPTQEAIDELTSMYFEKMHPAMPMLHKYRYYASMNLGPKARPPICLRYAMWALSACVTEKYALHQDIFYRRARKYLQIDELKGVGESFVSVAHAQTWTLIATYEFKMMYFPRAWMSVGRSTRMIMMMGLNRMDRIGMDVKQCLPPPKDWIEREERRRTFWMSYVVDKYASIGTGWPMSIDDRDILTTLPASEEAYENDIPETMPFLSDLMTNDKIARLAPWAGTVYITHFFGLNIAHLHRPEPDEQEQNWQGKFWKRHRHMDNLLSNTSLALPPQLRLPQGIRNINVISCNFLIHTTTICLHQAAIFKAEKNNLPNSVIENSRRRCLLAAQETSDIMRMASHMDLTGMSPFIAFSLYVAARVFVQYLKLMPQDSEIKASLEFILIAMTALRKKNPLTESFMVQLNVDLESSGLNKVLNIPDFINVVKTTDSPYCKEEMLSRSEDSATSISATQSPHPTTTNASFYNPSHPRVTTSYEGSYSSTSVSSDSPRQTQYSLNNVELAARSNLVPERSISREANQKVGQDEPFTGILPGKTRWGWSTNSNVENPAVGVNPLVNNGIDADLFDQTGSTGMTPQSGTNQSSSNTSYSPPSGQDEEALSQHPFPQLKQQPTSLDEAFKISTAAQTPNWDMSGNDMGTETGTGMTPVGPEDWAKLMQGMNWDPTTMSPPPL